METNEIIKFNSGILKAVSNSISVTDKLLSKTEQQLIPYRKRDKWGFCTPDKKIVIDCIYDEVERFVNGSSVFKKKGLYGILDKNGNEHLEGKYRKIQNLSDGLRAVSGKWVESMGFIDENFNEVIPLKYIGVGHFNYFKNGMVKVRDWVGNRGFLDTKGNLVVDYKYNHVNDFNEDLAIVLFNGKLGFKGKKFGVIDKQGNEIIKIKNYDWLNNFSERLAANTINDKCGFIDSEGNQILPLKYDEIEGDFGFSDGFAGVYTIEDNWHFIDKNGNGLIKDEDASFLSFTSLQPFYKGYASVWNYQDCGVIDKVGNLVIDFKYDFIKEFHEGMALAKKDNHAGYIDINENVLIPFMYIEGGNFLDGIASVCIDKNKPYQNNYINKNGVEYWED